MAVAHPPLVLFYRIVARAPFGTNASCRSEAEWGGRALRAATGAALLLICPNPFHPRGNQPP
jgi:hypothetical protein